MLFISGTPAEDDAHGCERHPARFATWRLCAGRDQKSPILPDSLVNPPHDNSPLMRMWLGPCPQWCSVLAVTARGTDPTNGPEGPRTQSLRFLIPKTLPCMDLGTRILLNWVLGSLVGYCLTLFETFAPLSTPRPALQ